MKKLIYWVDSLCKPKACHHGIIYLFNRDAIVEKQNRLNKYPFYSTQYYSNCIFVYCQNIFVGDCPVFRLISNFCFAIGPLRCEIIDLKTNSNRFGN